ncbi:MAG: tRNA (adenosine(37)-N6)-threonylcarbamoyltransferase complex ATPase subunit type 1 TsaE [Candidatus Omnitrophota bacterium]
MITERLSQSPDETLAIGETIGSQLKGHEVILLIGELGVGKTLLTKGIARALGIDPDEVVSPSFTLVNEFKGRNGWRLIHVDLYRLGPSTSSHLPEIDDYLGEAIIIIEWAQYLPPAYFQLTDSITITFHLKPGDESQRILTIEAASLASV